MAVLDITSIVLVGAGGILLVPAAILFLEVLAAFLPSRPAREQPTAHPRIAVLVPAHNEAAGIAPVLTCIAGELSPQDRLLVVADNCSDDTGRIADDGRAEVIHRIDPALRGKGYALDFGVRHLAPAPPDVVIVVDADSTPEPGSLQKIASLALALGRPVQARYELKPPRDRMTPYLKVAALAWQVKNYVRPLGLNRLGLPCQLMGTGMAFPWPVISMLDLRTGNIVEDLALGHDLAAKGLAPVFCPEASVTSRFPANEEGQQIQRTRWETGHLNTIARGLPGLLGNAVSAANLDLLVLALDAAVPPLAFLALAILAISAAGVLMLALGGSSVPLVLGVLAALLMTGAVLLARLKLGKDTISLLELSLIPAYVISKLVLYSRIVAGKQVKWIRSKRD